MLDCKSTREEGKGVALGSSWSQHRRLFPLRKFFLKQKNNRFRFALKNIQQIITRCKVSKIFVFHITVESYL